MKKQQPNWPDWCKTDADRARHCREVAAGYPDTHQQRQKILQQAKRLEANTHA